MTVRAGQTLAIIGPSGGGKSTLLRIVAGEETKFQGDIFFDNRRMNGVKGKERYLSFIFQDFARFPHFKEQNRLDAILRRYDKLTKETEEQIRLTAAMMSLDQKALFKRKQGKISGSDELRLAIGRAMVRNPDLFLFDEPLSTFDPKIRAQTRVEIKRLLRQFRMTALFVTHDQTEALAIGDQIAVINAGRLEQIGTARDVYQYPTNTFVAEFLGLPPMNLFEGGTVSDGAVRISQLEIPLPDTVRSKTRTGQSITVGIRPEELRLVMDDRPQPDGLQLRARVEAIEPNVARNTQSIHLRTDGLSYLIRTPLTTPVMLEHEVEVVFPFEHLSFFDSDSTQRIG